MTRAALLAIFLLQTADPTLLELENAYDQTCNSRIYGQFDDMCSAMAERLKAYRADLRRRPHAKTAEPPAATAPAAVAPPGAPPVEPHAATPRW